MKQHLKNYLKLGILLFGISTFLVNCQKDDFQEQEGKASKKPPNLTATIQRGGKLIESNKALKEQLVKFTKSENSTVVSRTIYSSEYDFSIDTTYIQQIETATYNSFTFSVERDNPNPDILENYVFTSFNNGNTKQYLISYPIVNSDSEQEYDITNATIQSINDDTLIYSRGEGCWASIVEYEDPVCVNYNCGLSGNHSPGEACDDGEYRAYTECTGGGWVERCTTPGGGGTSGGSDYDPNDTTNGGNTGTDTNTDNTNEEEEEEVVVVVFETKKPCPGDPVPNIELAHQLGLSGWKGGLFGNEYINGCTRYGANHCSTPRNKRHNGLDLVNPYGAPIYAMYDGVVTKITQYKEDGVTVTGAGHYISIISTVNGEEIKIIYFHMQEDSRASRNVNAGDIIGYQGDSGNLKSAIEKGNAVSHLHIKVKDSNNNAIEPRDYLGTEMDVNGNVTTNTNCN